MILSHKYRFIFIKTRKTAGTSVEISLSRFCGPDDVITPISVKDELIRRKMGVGPRNYDGFLPDWKALRHGRLARGFRYWNHMRASQIRRRVGRRIWNSYFKFCFERNPWDKTVSLFHHERKHKKAHRWEDNIESFLQHREHRLPSDFRRYTIGGLVAVDRIGRYEQLEHDLTHICQQVGIEFDGWLPRAKGNFRTDRRHYTDVLNARQRDIVSKRFAQEIQLLGYSFST